MASVLWKIKYAGLTKPAAEWGAQGLIRTLNNLEVDTLTFRIPRASLYFACPFAYGGQLELYRGAVRFFSGTVQPPAATGDGSSGQESWYVTVAGPWQQLQRITYQQYRVLQNSDFSDLVARYTPQVVLGQDDWGRKVSTDFTIAQIAAYALSQASGIFVISSIDDGVIPPITDARNISTAAAIRRQLEWTPDAAAWFDYAVTPTPNLYIQRRGSMGPLAIDLEATPIRGLSSLRKRDDMVPAGVVFTFITLEENVLTSEQFPRYTDQVAGASAGPGVIFASFSLANQGTAQAELIPAGLAAAYYASLLTPFWEGQLSLVEQECTGFARPGQLLNIQNGNPDWATMAAVINSVSEDLDRGITTISIGLPPTLGADDFRELMAKARNTKPASDDSAKIHNGTVGVAVVDGGPGHAPGVSVEDRVPNTKAGATSGPTGVGGSSFSAEFCIDGSTKTKTVLGA